ncbi:MAG: hypothetical protein RL757_892 [Bacteroidota bacterium]|jgi:hypothetical protein
MKNSQKSIVLAFLSFFIINILSAQCIEGNCQDGKGTFQYDDGSKYVGAFQNNKPNGKGSLSFANGNRYEGDWSNGQRQGKGIFTMSSGNVYIGDLRQNRFSGNGKMTLANGDRYEGAWENDQPNGFGKYTFRSNEQYEGMFKSGKFDGIGIMLYVNGDRFEGAWQNNRRHGEGKLIRKTGITTVGIWENGELKSTNQTAEKPKTEEKNRNCNDEYCRDGKGEYKYSDGSRWVGDFREGMPAGEGTCYYANGDRYIGQYEKHAPHGRGIMYFANGRVLGAIWEFGRAIGELPANDKPINTVVEVDHDPAVKVWAVIVGIERYTAMPNLKYSGDDAHYFHSFLRSPEGGALADEQVKVLIDEDATRANILQTMRQVLLRADENDVIVFYFSGHGLDGSFLPIDYDGFNNRLSHADVKNVLGESQAKYKICFADACHSGALLALKQGLTQQATIDKYYSAFKDVKGGLALFMSSKAEEYSLEDQSLRSGIFSHYLIKGLKGGADSDKNKIVTIRELFDFVYKNVRTYTSGAQTPIISGNYDVNMPVSALRDK